MIDDKEDSIVTKLTEAVEFFGPLFMILGGVYGLYVLTQNSTTLIGAIVEELIYVVGGIAVLTIISILVLILNAITKNIPDNIVFYAILTIFVALAILITLMN